MNDVVDRQFIVWRDRAEAAEAALERSITRGSDAVERIATLEAALREAERFVSYLANETDGIFAGSGTPTTCLVMIRAALAPEQDK